LGQIDTFGQMPASTNKNNNGYVSIEQSQVEAGQRAATRLLHSPFFHNNRSMNSSPSSKKRGSSRVMRTGGDYDATLETQELHYPVKSVKYPTKNISKSSGSKVIER